MTRPLIGIFDVLTQEQVVREMNDEEFAQYELDKSESVKPTG
jgi:hypothetical protein